MRTRYSDNQTHKGLRRRLLAFELIIFFICMLIASMSEAQDVTPPSIVTLSPADDAVEIPVDQWTWQITFDEDIQLNFDNTRPFIVMRDEAGFLIANIDINTGGATVTGSTLDIDFNWDGSLDASPLNENERYNIEIVSDLIRDLAGNSFDGFVDNDTWNFFTPDTQGPEYFQLTPANGATGILVNEVVEIQFSEQTNLGTGTIDMYEGTTLIESFDVTSPQVTHGNAASTSRISTSFNLLPEKTYNIRLSTGAVEDFTGNPFDGITDETTWVFTTMDDESIPPVLDYVYPEHMSTDVVLADLLGPDGDGIYFEFDEDIIAGTGNIEVRRSSDDALVQSYSMSDGNVDVSSNAVSVYNIESLPYNTELYVLICSTCVTDVLGNAYPGNTAGDWVFTTELGPLAIETVSPDFNSTNDHVLYLDGWFNQNIVLDGLPTDRALEVYRYSDDQFVSFASVEDVTVTDNHLQARLAIDIPSGDEVYVSIVDNRIKDLSDNYIDPIDKDFWKFTTNWDYVERLEFVPSNFSIQNPIDGEIKIVYGEDVKKGFSGNYTFRKYTGSEIVESFDYSSNLITINGSEVIFEVNHLLEYNTRYFITILGNPIRSLNDVPAEGFNNNSTFVFTIEPDPALFAQPVTYTPAHMQTDVAIDTDISIEFTNPVTSGNGFLLFYNRSTGSFLQSVNTSTNMTVTGNTATISLDSDLPYETEVAVRVTDAAFISENHGVLEITDNDTWYFTTEDEPDVTPPSIVSLSPADNATDVPNDSDLVIEFDEEVMLGNSSFLVKFYDNNVNQYVINYASEDVVLDGNTITISPPSSLQGETHYWVQINANTITDAAGNGFPGILLANRDDWDFTTVGKLDQTISFVTPEDKTFGDAPFTLSATASSGLPVTFDVVSGPVSISGNEVTILGAGGASIRADQEGNVEYNSANVQIVSFAINKADQVITIDAISDKITTDAPFSVTGSTTSGLTLEYAVTEGPATISGSEITLTGTSGTVTVEATQAGNDNYLSASASTSFNVTDPAKTDQTIAFDAISDKAFGDSDFNLSATASSGLEVSFSVVSGPVTVSGSVVTITGAGTAVIAANQAGDGSFNPAEEVTITFTIAKAAQTITIDAIPDKLITDNPFDVSASTTSNLPLSFEVEGPATISGTTISLTGGTGLVTVTASQAGNENYLSASASTSFQVTDPAKMDQTITFDAISDKAFGENFSLTASASSGLDVVFTVVNGPITINGTDVMITGTGSATITANQAGDEAYNAAPEVTQSFSIVKADQVISITQVENKLTTNTPFDIEASVDSQLELTYEVTGPASISGTTVTLSGSAGTVTISVSQTGNDNYNAASASESFEVSKADQTITVDAIDDKLTTDAPFEISASTDSGLELTFDITGPATISGTTVTLTGASGTVTVTVNQVGNDTYNSASESVSFEVTEENALNLEDELVDIKVYPNPVVNVLQIESETRVSLRLFDLNGKILIQDLFSPGRLDLSELNPGVYMLEIVSDSSKILKRVVKSN